MTRVEVTGTSVLTAEQVVAAADAPVGRPLARVDTDAVAARVAGLAPVREVEVSRGWPSTLRVEVTERTPVLATGSGRQLTLVDAEGVGYTTVAELPEGVVRATLAEEVPAEDRHELLVDLATVVRALPAPLLEQVERVGTASADTIELHLAEDRVVEWGSADDSALKAEVAVVLLEQEGEVYNVTVPSHPTVR
nr:FtsQ-type POTRA domain-containing protein [Auraticoccus cholistanensis]